MASVTLKEVYKVFPGNVTAVSDFLSNPDDSDVARFKNFDNSPYNTIVIDQIIKIPPLEVLLEVE